MNDVAVVVVVAADDDNKKEERRLKDVQGAFLFVFLVSGSFSSAFGLFTHFSTVIQLSLINYAAIADLIR